MREYMKEKQDAEHFITAVVKQLKPEDKQRVADILLGFKLATPERAYPMSGIPARG